MYQKLKEFCQGLGIELFGVADITAMREDILLAGPIKERLTRAVCLGAALSEAVLEDVADHPTRLYFHHYKTVNAFLDQSAYRLSSRIQKEGFLALPVPASQIVDWEKQTAMLSHKHVARLAGLGWIGRNNLLVNEKLGARLRLVSVLTDMPLEADKPMERDCGPCRACVDACPCKAIAGAPSDFDHLKCFAQLKDFQKKRFVEQFICGVCVRACRGKGK